MLGAVIRSVEQIGLVGVGLFLVGMEEISWGQRMFGVAPPAFFHDNSRQDEINIHNLGPIQVLLDYVYFAIGFGGGLGWLIVPPLKRRLLDPARLAGSPIPRETC